MMDRRKFLKYIGVAGTAAAMLRFNPLKVTPANAFVPVAGPPWPTTAFPSPPIYPTSDTYAFNLLLAKKYQDPLLSAVPAFTPTSGNVYDVQMAPTLATVSSAFGAVTKVYAYGAAANNATLHYPGFSFDVNQGSPIVVNFYNNLPNGDHLLPYDPTLDGTMSMPGALPLPAGFTLPPMDTVLPQNRATVHLHGGDVAAGFDDGWPEWWTVPAGSPNITAPQVQTVHYPNNQPGCCLWYHDHAMGATRLNVFAGLAGFYFIRDAVEASLNIPRPGNDAKFEVPLVIQDRLFSGTSAADPLLGQFLYPQIGSGGTIADINSNMQTWPSGRPVWVPEFFGDVAVVNGTAWPNMNVQARKYRFRMLNGCNARMLNLSLRIEAPLGGVNTIPFYVIGTDQGFLHNTLTLDSLFMTPAHRYDVIVDFSKVPVGAKVYLASDSVGPWPGGGSNVLYEIMSFTVGPVTNSDNTDIPRHPDMNYHPLGGRIAAKRYITLNEWMDPGTMTSMGMLLGEGLAGGSDPAIPGGRNGKAFNEPATITPRLGTTEDWYFINRTGDGHPMHVHLVRFQFIKRFFIDAAAFDATGALNQVGPTLGGLPFDEGWKDTILTPPGDGVSNYQVTVVRANFTRPGAYPYHCHIVDHEDNDMMRWFNVI